MPRGTRNSSASLGVAALPRRSLRAWLLIVAIGILLVCVGRSGVAQQAAHLRGDVPTSSQLQASLDALAVERDALTADRARLETELAIALAVVGERSIAEQQLAVSIEVLRETARQAAVNVYVNVSPEVTLTGLLQAERAADVSWGQHLLNNAFSAPAQDRAVLLLELEAQADDVLLAEVSVIEGLRDGLDVIDRRLSAINDGEAELEQLRVAAEAWDRAEAAIATGRWGFVSQQKWEKMRFCESSDNYQALSRTGKYRGAFQFDFATWESVGGSGDPAAASPSEQEARARELYARRGHDPWPVCGRFLR